MIQNEFGKVQEREERDWCILILDFQGWADTKRRHFVFSSYTVPQSNLFSTTSLPILHMPSVGFASNTKGKTIGKVVNWLRFVD